MDRAFLRILTLAGACSSGMSLHAQFTDDFSDGDFSADPAWGGSTALFTVDAGRLRSNSPGAGTYSLSTPSTQALEAQWAFLVDLRFSTSGANYADVYLVSDAADLATAVNGYFVRIGDTDDNVVLYRSDAGTAVPLVASATGIVNSSTSNPFRIQVTRDASDNWSLFFDDGASGTYTLAGTAVDATYGTSTHFGLRIVQSSAAGPVNNHFFDDFAVGAIVVDTEPPTLLSASATSATTVDARFSEAVEQVSAEAAGHYGLVPAVGIASVTRDGTDLAWVHLTLAAPLTNGTDYTLTATDVTDMAGNATPGTSTVFPFVVPDVPLPGDVVINEIMADPTPVVGLPEAEFVELYNATDDKTFDLAGWTFGDGGTTATLPAYLLTPHAYVLLTSTVNEPLFAAVPGRLGAASFPSLNNDGDPLSLQAPDNTVIDAVTYALGWYHDAVKDDGGWTLERIDPTAPCSGPANWTASTAPAGGTPGVENSVYSTVPDTQAPALTAVAVDSPTAIALTFSEPMDEASLLTGSYTLVPAIGIANVAVPDPAHAVLTLASPLTAGQLTTLTVTGVTDCPGNAIGTANTATFALPEPVAAGDVVINEVLYDPPTGGSDFVEIYNRSQKVLSLAGWLLANEDDGVVDDRVPITTEALLLLPGAYLLLTEDAEITRSAYPLAHADRFRETDLPSYNNGTGTVVLLGPDSALLDRFTYDDDLHFELLNTTEGVSLERIDPARPSDDPSNWHSAAADVGFATPGYVNSQHAPAAAAQGELSIDPAIFSPDNDGHQDVLTIGYRFREAGFVGTMKVFDIAGREVRTLMDNVLLSATGAISWDGIMGTGELARMGPYVVYLEAYDLSGNVEEFRSTVVLAHRLD